LLAGRAGAVSSVASVALARLDGPNLRPLGYENSYTGILPHLTALLRPFFGVSGELLGMSGALVERRSL
jgi:hypothetical protein